MLSPQEKLSDHISEVFGAVGATGFISSADYQTLQLACNDSGLERHERKSIVRLLRAVQRGKVNIVPSSMVG